MIKHIKSILKYALHINIYAKVLTILVFVFCSLKNIGVGNLFLSSLCHPPAKWTYLDQT